MPHDIREWPYTERFSVMDIEGDGHPDNRPIEISVIDFDNGQMTGNHYWLINPERKIQEFACKHIHGITDKMVRRSPTFRDIEHEFRSAITNKVLVGHGIRNDFNILQSVIDSPERLLKATIDTATLAKMVLKRKDKIGLEKVCNILGIRIPDEYRCPRPGFHGATEDAYATGQLMFELPKLLPDDPKVIKHVSLCILGSLRKPRQVPVLTIENEETPVGLKP